MSDFSVSFEESTVASWAISAGEQGIAGSSAGGGLDVVLLEGATACGEGIDVGGVDVVGAEAFELGAEIIDADEEDVLLRTCGLRKEGCCEQETKESEHGGKTKGPKWNDDVFLSW